VAAAAPRRLNRANHGLGRVHCISMILCLHAGLPMTIAPVLRLLIRATDDDDDSKQDPFCNASRQSRQVVTCTTHPDEPTTPAELRRSIGSADETLKLLHSPEIRPSVVFIARPYPLDSCAELPPKHDCQKRIAERSSFSTAASPCMLVNTHRAAYCCALACLNSTSSSAACASPIALLMPSTCA
jgi:hypothetical protein